MAIRFTRTRYIRAGKGAEAMALGARFSEYFSENQGVDMAWGVQTGGPMGAVFFYMDVEDWNQMTAVTNAIFADEQYLALETEADDVFLQGGNDTLVVLQ